jgi:hypothetical protein
MVFDQRTFNSRRNPSIQHKLRIVNPGNRTGNTYAVTIPVIIANNFSGTYFRITQEGTSLILASGARIGATNITNKKDNSFNGLRMVINKYGQPEWIK